MRIVLAVGLCWALGFSAWANDTGEVQTGEEFQTTGEAVTSEEATSTVEGGPNWSKAPLAASWTEHACMSDGNAEACLYQARRIIRRHQRKGASNAKLVQANVFLSRAVDAGNSEAELILSHIVSARNAAPVGTALADVEYAFNLKNLNPKTVRRDFQLKSLTPRERKKLKKRFGIKSLDGLQNDPVLRTDPEAIKKVLDITVQASEQNKTLQALTIAADNGNLHSRTVLGQSSMELGDYTEAEQHFTQACNVNYGEACVNLGYLYYVQEDYLSSVSVLNQSCADGYARSCFYSYRVRGQVRKTIRKSHYDGRPTDRFVNTTPEEVRASAQPVALVESMRHACDQDVAEACSDLGHSLVPREIRREIKKEDFERRGDVVTEGRWLIQYVIVPGVYKYTIKIPYNKVLKPTGQFVNQFILQPVSRYTVRPVIKFTKFWWRSYQDDPQPKNPKRLKEVVIARPGEVPQAFRKACELDSSLTSACRFHKYFEGQFQPLEQ